MLLIAANPFVGSPALPFNPNAPSQQQPQQQRSQQPPHEAKPAPSSQPQYHPPASSPAPAPVQNAYQAPAPSTHEVPSSAPHVSSVDTDASNLDIYPPHVQQSQQPIDPEGPALDPLAALQARLAALNNN